jgi:hypothetical protein
MRTIPLLLLPSYEAIRSSCLEEYYEGSFGTAWLAPADEFDGAQLRAAAEHGGKVINGFGIRTPACVPLIGLGWCAYPAITYTVLPPPLPPSIAAARALRRFNACPQAVLWLEQQGVAALRERYSQGEDIRYTYDAERASTEFPPGTLTGVMVTEDEWPSAREREAMSALAGFQARCVRVGEVKYAEIRLSSYFCPVYIPLSYPD